MIDLQQFCAGPDENRPALEQPWREGDYVYASNGKVLLRVLADDFSAVKERTGTPKMGTWDFDGIRGWQEWMTIPAVLPEPRTAECGACYGAGEHACEKCGTNHDCGKCKGKGTREIAIPVEIGTAKIDAKQLRLLAKLPGILIEKRDDRASEPRTFKCDCGEGFVATFKEEEK